MASLNAGSLGTEMPKFSADGATTTQPNIKAGNSIGTDSCSWSSSRPVRLKRADSMFSMHILDKAIATTEKQRTSNKCQTMERLVSAQCSQAVSLPIGNGIVHNCRLGVYYCLQSQRFDAAIGVVILANTMAIGIETEVDLRGGSTVVFEVLEHCFLCTYGLELALRFFAHGLSCLKSGWVRFDLFLFTVGSISSLVSFVLQALPTGVERENSQGLQTTEVAHHLVFLKVLRILRMARALRVFVQFRILWKLVRGLISSAGTMFYTLLIISLMLYIFSVAAVELITKNPRADPEHMLYSNEWHELVLEHYPSILRTMVTLIQFVILDSIREQWLPLVEADPSLIVFFVLFILVVSVTMMNLVTAVIVEGSLAEAKHDHAVEKMAQVSRILPRLREVFYNMDIDNSGTITMSKIWEAAPEARLELMKLVESDNLQELFDMLDVDCAGEVQIDEFIDGIARLVTTEQPVEFVRIMKQNDLTRIQVNELQEQLEALTHTLSPQVGNRVEATDHLPRPPRNLFSELEEIKILLCPVANSSRLTCSDNFSMVGETPITSANNGAKEFAAQTFRNRKLSSPMFDKLMPGIDESSDAVVPAEDDAALNFGDERLRPSLFLDEHSTSAIAFSQHGQASPARAADRGNSTPRAADFGDNELTPAIAGSQPRQDHDRVSSASSSSKPAPPPPDLSSSAPASAASIVQKLLLKRHQLFCQRAVFPPST